MSGIVLKWYAVNKRQAKQVYCIYGIKADLLDGEAQYVYYNYGVNLKFYGKTHFCGYGILEKTECSSMV